MGIAGTVSLCMTYSVRIVTGIAGGSDIPDMFFMGTKRLIAQYVRATVAGVA